MNYLEAHKIVNKYIEVIAGKKSTVPFLKRNDLPFSQEDLALAFKLHLAIVHRYGKNIYTQEEANELSNLMRLVYFIPWVDDQFANEYMECREILDNTSWFGKIKNRTAIPYVQEKIDRLNAELMPSSQAVANWLNEVEVYEKSLAEIVKQSVIFTNNVPSDAAERHKRNIENATKYCLDVYDLLNLDVTKKDIRLFWPLPMLYKFINQPSWEQLYTAEQKRYITNNKQG